MDEETKKATGMKIPETDLEGIEWLKKMYHFFFESIYIRYTFRWRCVQPVKLSYLINIIIISVFHFALRLLIFRYSICFLAKRIALIG